MKKYQNYYQTKKLSNLMFKILRDKKLISCNLKTRLEVVIKKITNNRCGGIIITKNKKFYGYLQEGDIKKKILNKNILKIELKDVINRNPLILKSEDSLSKQIKTLRKNNRLRAPIINQKKEIKGIMYFHKENDVIKDLKINKDLRKNILLVGGAGYIGSILCEELLKKNFIVTIFDKFKFGLNSINHLRSRKNLEIIKGDTNDTKMLYKVCFGKDAIVDLSGLVGDPACAVNENNTIVNNYINTKNLIDIAQLLNVKRFIYISSCSVYGASKKNQSLNEKSFLNPVSLYAETKVLVEKYLFKSKNKNFEPVILRLATVFGLSPRLRFDLVVNLFTLMIYAKKNITVFGGNQFRPLVHVKDVSNAITKCLVARSTIVKKQIFNVGSNNLNLTIQEIAEKIKEINPKIKINLEHQIEDKRNYIVNFNKINSKLKFKTKYNITNGSIELYNYLKKKKIKNLKNVIFFKFSIELKNLYN